MKFEQNLLFVQFEHLKSSKDKRLNINEQQHNRTEYLSYQYKCLNSHRIK